MTSNPVFSAEVAKAAYPVLQSYLKTLEDTDWMYPTPACFKAQPSNDMASTYGSIDLPAFNTQMDWMDKALNLNDAKPLEDVPAFRDSLVLDAHGIGIGEAEAELEMSFAESTNRAHRFSHGQLLQDVALLGV